MLEYAFEHPIDFLEHCCEAFKEALGEISDEAPAAKETRVELQAYVDSIPMIQRTVKERFAGELCS